MGGREAEKVDWHHPRAHCGHHPVGSRKACSLWGSFKRLRRTSEHFLRGLGLLPVQGASWPSHAAGVLVPPAAGGCEWVTPHRLGEQF